jgi:DNA repair exonuclease SbcCD ATPase subunit
MKRWQIVALAMGVASLALAPGAQANWLQKQAEKLQEAARKAAAGNDSATQAPATDEAPADSVVKDAATGAAVCGGITAATGGDARNIAIAGAACGAANGAITVLGNRGKKRYAAEYREISDEQQATEQKIAELERSKRQAEKKASELDSRAKQLAQAEKDDKVFIAKAQKLRKELDGEIARVRGDTTTAQAKLAVIENQIASLDRLIKESPDIEDYKTTHQSLLAQKKTLNDQIKGSNGLSDTLVAQKEALDDEIIQRG